MNVVNQPENIVEAERENLIEFSAWSLEFDERMYANGADLFLTNPGGEVHEAVLMCI